MQAFDIARLPVSEPPASLLRVPIFLTRSYIQILHVATFVHASHVSGPVVGYVSTLDMVHMELITSDLIVDTDASDDVK